MCITVLPVTIELLLLGLQSVVTNSEELSSPTNGSIQVSSITAMEKSLLLALALKWQQQSDNLNTDQIQDLEREIWLSHIHSTMEELENKVSAYKLSRQLIVSTSL